MYKILASTCLFPPTLFILVAFACRRLKTFLSLNKYGIASKKTFEPTLNTIACVDDLINRIIACGLSIIKKDGRSIKPVFKDVMTNYSCQHSSVYFQL